MENKEIYIDGVDVSEWTDEEVRYKFEKHSPKAIRQIAFDLYKQLERKKQECERLKHDNGYEVGALEKTIDNLKKEIDKLKAENEKLEQTLTEIKEFIQSDYCTEIASCEFCAEVGNCLNRKILQKISECEVE